MKRAVTEKDVDKLVKDGTVYVGRDVLLTPSAREQISKRGYKVVYGEEKEKASPPVPAEELARMVEAVVRAEISRAPDGAREIGRAHV